MEVSWPAPCVGSQSKAVGRWCGMRAPSAAQVKDDPVGCHRLTLSLAARRSRVFSIETHPLSLIVRPYADSSKLSYTTTILSFYVITAHTQKLIKEKYISIYILFFKYFFLVLFEGFYFSEYFFFVVYRV